MKPAYHRHAAAVIASLLSPIVLSCALFSPVAMAADAPAHAQPSEALAAKALTNEVSISGQVALDALAQVRGQGYQTIIDLRPDGEASNQPSAAAMEAAAKAAGLVFAYVPVAPGAISDAAMEGASKAINAALASKRTPILIYCGSGRRATRTWSLVEASRPGGMDVEAIVHAAAKGGHSVEDLRGDLAERVARRGK